MTTKKIRDLVLLLLMAKSTVAQTISPSVITPQGAHYVAGGMQLSWTTGGVATSTFGAGGYVLTQGFEQPELQVWTGAIGPSGVCPGSVINVPYTQSGIISNSNIFTAELSDASGSFASPVTVGTLTARDNGTIACTIPAGTVAGSGYRIRVRSSLPLFRGPDNGNNLSIWSRPSCNITVVPENNTNTGGIPSNIYLGYGPQRVTLNVSASGGAPFSYNWTGNGALSCNHCASPVFTPATEGVYNFTVTVTNANGCTTTCTVMICVLDIRVPGTGGKKVYVCHNNNTQSVNINAVPSHVPGHANDRLGRCDEQPCNPSQPLYVNKGENIPVAEEIVAEEFSAAVMPNPTRDHFNLSVKSNSKAPVTVRVVDIYGRVLLVQTGIAPNTITRLGDKLFSGTYLVNVVQEKREQTLKVIKIN